jgi:hypothetical protein
MEIFMSYEYELQHGSYYLYNAEKAPNALTKQRDIVLMCDEVAIAFDKEAGVLHKHGIPENVTKWYNTTREKLISSGFPEMADDLILIQGAFPVEELNKCLSTTGYIGVFWKKLQNNQLTSAKLKV